MNAGHALKTMSEDVWGRGSSVWAAAPVSDHRGFSSLECIRTSLLRHRPTCCQGPWVMFQVYVSSKKGGSYVLHMFLTILFQVCPEWGPGLPGVNRFQDGSAQIVAGVVFWSRSGKWSRSLPGTVTAGRGSPQPWRKPRMRSRTLHPVLDLTLPSCVTLRDYPELASLQHEPHHL